MIIAITAIVGVLAVAIATVPVLIGMHLHEKDEPWTNVGSNARVDNVDDASQSGARERSSVLTG